MTYSDVGRFLPDGATKHESNTGSEREFSSGGEIFGYSKFLMEDGKIVGLKGENKPEIRIGQIVGFKTGDIYSPVPDGFKVVDGKGDQVNSSFKVIGFHEPHTDFCTDDIVKVRRDDNGVEGWLKPNELVV